VSTAFRGLYRTGITKVGSTAILKKPDKTRRELAALITTVLDTPRSAFHYQYRSRLSSVVNANESRYFTPYGQE